MSALFWNGARRGVRIRGSKHRVGEVSLSCGREPIPPTRLPGPYFDLGRTSVRTRIEAVVGSTGTQREDDSVPTASDPDKSAPARLQEALAGDQPFKKRDMQ